ncbi:hypothetical protein B0H17DRAFT_1062857, partial [Mycena rosella]
MSGGRGCFNCGGCALSSLSPLPFFFSRACFRCFPRFRDTYGRTGFYLSGTLL